MAEELKTEEDVKFKFLVPLLKSYGYKENCIGFNVTVEVQEGRKKKSIFADAVVYSSSSKKTPLVLCETKTPSEILDKFVKEQGISYARLLPKIAPLVLITFYCAIFCFFLIFRGRGPDLGLRGGK